jgi:CRISPR-associated protein (TIGR03986 family)
MPATAPYNFVPLPTRFHEAPEQNPPSYNRFDPDLYTGWLVIQIVTRSPVYTRAARGVSKNFAAPVGEAGGLPADFFHRGDAERQPILPGSSLRGMFRSIFEIITRSKISFVSERRLFYRFFAAGQPELRQFYNDEFLVANVEAGVLNRKDEEWILTIGRKDTPEADRGFVVVGVDDPRLGHVTGQPPARRGDFYKHGAGKLFEAREVSVRLLKRTATLLRGDHAMNDIPQAELCDAKAAGALPGFLLLHGKDIQKRRWYQVVLRNDGTTPLRTMDVPEDVYDDYLTWGQMAHGSRFNKKGEAPRKLVKGSPCFALLHATEDRAEVIGANLMMPLRYERSIREVAEQSYGRAQGSALRKRDMTEMVFGHVATDNADGEAIRSRVFFEDALCRTPDPFLSPDGAEASVRIPSVLGGPKPTAFQTYLQQPGGGRLRHWGSSDAKIRGFKRYWHRSDATVQSEELAADVDMDHKSDLGTQKTRICPVRSGVAFTGRIRFENLNDEELGALYASVQLPDTLAHKFGMGKNLGLGSVEVKVTHLALLDPRTRWASIASDAGLRSPEETGVLLRNAYAAFLKRVYPGQESLWADSRMRALAALLSNYPRLQASATRQVGIQEGGRDNQWRRRDALPEVQDFPRFPPVSEPQELGRL